MANHGPWNARAAGGHLYLTNRRLVFRPTLVESFTQEQPWEAPLSAAMVTVGPGQWPTRAPVIRYFALRYDIDVLLADGTEEHFFVTHLGEPLEALAAHSGPDLGLGGASGQSVGRNRP
jgi:hypothetical protein